MDAINTLFLTCKKNKATLSDLTIAKQNLENLEK